MTVPPLFGWEHILLLLLGIIVVTLAGLVLLAAGKGGRSEWRAELDERSARRHDGSEDELADASSSGRTR